MSKLLKVTVRTVKNGVEGVYQLPNSTNAKLAAKSGATIFANRGSLSQAAQRLATSIGWKSELVDTQMAKAAKKSNTPKKTCASKSKKTCSK